MTEWRKFPARQKAMRRRKNQVGVKNMVTEEIIVQCMSMDVSRKKQKYTRIGAQDYMPFTHKELTISNVKDALCFPDRKIICLSCFGRRTQAILQ